MRIILMNVQVAFLLILGFAVAAAGGFLAAMPSLAAGVGPAAMAAGVYVLMVCAAALVGLVAFAIPYALISGSTLFFAFTAGYRYLRLTRFLGILANLVGAAYFIVLQYSTRIVHDGILVPLLLLPAFNILFLLLLPRRPRIRLTRRMAKLAQPVLFMIPLSLALCILFAGGRRWSAGELLAIVIVFGLYFLPFLYNYRTVTHVARDPGPGLLVKLAIAAGLATLGILIFFPMGLFLAMGTLLLFETAEISLLYPEQYPPVGGMREWVARIGGRRPAGPAPAGAIADRSLTSLARESGAKLARNLAGTAAVVMREIENGVGEDKSASGDADESL